MRSVALGKPLLPSCVWWPVDVPVCLVWASARQNQSALPTASGVGVTRHPRMGAVEQPWVAVREPVESRQLREKLREKAYPRAERTLLMGNYLSLNPLARLRPPCSVRSTAWARCGPLPKSSSGGAR